MTHREYLSQYGTPENPFAVFMSAMPEELKPRFRDYVTYCFGSNYQKFLKQFDFVALDLPLDPEHYTAEDWTYFIEYLQEMAEYCFQYKVESRQMYG